MKKIMVIALSALLGAGFVSTIPAQRGQEEAGLAVNFQMQMFPALLATSMATSSAQGTLQPVKSLRNYPKRISMGSSTL